MNSETLLSFQKQIEPLLKGREPVYDLTCDKLEMYDIIQMSFTDDGDGGGHIPRLIRDESNVEMLRLLSGRSEEQVLRSFQSGRKETAALVESLFAFLEEAFSKTPAQLHREGIEIDRCICERVGNNFLGPYFSVKGGQYRIAWHEISMENALWTTLAVFRYQADHGDRPGGNLHELVSGGYLDCLPNDPFSDEPLIYKRNADTFGLYSVGGNCADDGGTGDDAVYWPVPVSISKPD